MQSLSPANPVLACPAFFCGGSSISLSFPSFPLQETNKTNSCLVLFLFTIVGERLRENSIIFEQDRQQSPIHDFTTRLTNLLTHLLLLLATTSSKSTHTTTTLTTSRPLPLPSATLTSPHYGSSLLWTLLSSPNQTEYVLALGNYIFRCHKSQLICLSLQDPTLKNSRDSTELENLEFLSIPSPLPPALTIAIMGGPEISKLYVPLTCHGHSRPVTHLSFSDWADDGDIYYLISACKGGFCQSRDQTVTNKIADNQPMLRDGVTGDWYAFLFCNAMQCDSILTSSRIGTFFGHKGAIYQARLSADANIAASASADFTTYVSHLIPAVQD